MAQSSRKVQGKIVAKVNGLVISVDSQPAKTNRGKNRLWVQIRQDSSGVKPWRVAASLSYARAVDIQFVDD